jgi:peptide deformylase
MTVRRITEIGNPVLRMTSLPVAEEDFGTEPLMGFVQDLVDTMRDYDGVGIAAPQVGIPARIFAIEVRVPDADREAEPFPLTIVMNPELELLEERIHPGWEGCLSVEGLRGVVPRARHARLMGRSLSGGPIELELIGFPAVIAQHEHDHLDGLVYLDRMPDLSSLATVRELARRAPTAQAEPE